MAQREKAAGAGTACRSAQSDLSWHRRLRDGSTASWRTHDGYRQVHDGRDAQSAFARFLRQDRCRHPESRNCLANLSARPATVLTTAALTSPCVAKAMRREVQTSESCTSLKSRHGLGASYASHKRCADYSPPEQGGGFVNRRGPSAGDRLRQTGALLRTEGVAGVSDRLRNRVANRIRPANLAKLPVSAAHFAQASQLATAGWQFPRPMPWSIGEPLKVGWICTPPAPGLAATRQYSAW